MDTSDYGLGVALSINIVGEEWPVAFTARTLSQVECNYSTLEKEALAAVWAINKQFLKFLLGHHFTIQLDQSSLMSLLSKSTSRASQRIQRWTEKLRNRSSWPCISLEKKMWLLISCHEITIMKISK